MFHTKATSCADRVEVQSATSTLVPFSSEVVHTIYCEAAIAQPYANMEFEKPTIERIKSTCAEYLAGRDSAFEA